MKQPSGLLIAVVAIVVVGLSLVGGILLESTQTKPDHTQKQDH